MTTHPTPLPLPGRRIGVSYESSSNLFCRDLTDGVQEAAAARGIAVIARDCAQSPQRQMADIADLLDAGVDALVISPEDPAAIGPALAAAAARGVPIVTVDRAADGPVLSHIISDNRLGGRLAADLLSAELGGQGQVAIVGRPWPGRFDAPHVTSTEQDVCAPRGLAPGEVMGGEGAEQQDPRNHSAWGRTVLLIGGPAGCCGRNVYSPWIRRRATRAMRASLTRSAHAVERGEPRRPHPWPSGPTSCLCRVPHYVAILRWCVVAKPPLDMPLLPSRGDWTR